MKTIFLKLLATIAFCQCISLSYASAIKIDKPTFTLQVISEETKYSGTSFQMTFLVTVNQPSISTFGIQLNSKYSFPFLNNESSYTLPNVFPEFKEAKEYKQTISIPLNPNSKLPYSYRRLDVNITSGFNIVDEKATTAFIYFTPWNTVEVWKQEDFEILFREWDSPAEDGNLKRTSVKLAEVPISNISREELIADTNLVYLNVPGLAYTVPMRYDAKASYIINDDSYEAPSDPTARQSPYEYWSGTITGTVTEVLPGYGSFPIPGIRVELWDKDGCILDFDDHIATTYADDQGKFTFNVSNFRQRVRGSINCFNEGTSLELYVKVKGENSDNSFRIEGFMGFLRDDRMLRSNPVGWDLYTYNVDLGTTYADADNLRGHQMFWNWLCRKTIAERANNIVANYRPLIMAAYPATTVSNKNYFYVPESFKSSIIASIRNHPTATELTPFNFSCLPQLGLNLRNQDCFYMADRDHNKPEAFFRMWGQYLYVMLGGEFSGPNYDDTYDIDFPGRSYIYYSFNHQFQKYNNYNPYEAFYIGFSMFFGALMDVHDNHIDHTVNINNIDGFDLEAGTYRGQVLEDIYWDRYEPNSASTMGDPFTLISKNYEGMKLGMASSFYISSFLWDLYDGNMNFSYNNSITIPNIDQSLPTENLAYSLSNILLPLKNGRPGKIDGEGCSINTIGEYLTELTRNDCNNPNTYLIYNVAEFNRLNYYFNQMTGKISYFRFGRDIIQTGQTYVLRPMYENYRAEDYFGVNVLTINYALKSDITFPYYSDLDTSFHDNYNAAYSIYNSSEFLKDPLIVNKGATIYFNKKDRIGEFSAQPTNMMNPATGGVNWNSCKGDAKKLGGCIQVLDKGKVVLGDPSNGINIVNFNLSSNTGIEVQNGGTFTISKGSSLNISPNATLVVRSGGTFIMDENASLLVQSGAYICFEEGSRLSFHSQAMVNIQPQANVGVAPNSEFQGSTSICTTKLNGCFRLFGNHPLFSNGCNGAIKFTTPLQLVSAVIPQPNTWDDFTIHFKFKRETGTTNPIDQHLITYDNGYAEKGFVINFINNQLQMKLGNLNLLNNQIIFNTDECHMIDVTRSSIDGSTNFYVDGNLIYTTYTPSGITSPSAPLVIGACNYAGSNVSAAIGTLGEFALWNRDVTPSEIAQFRNSDPDANYVNKIGLIVYYDMGQFITSYITDLSGHQYNGMLGGNYPTSANKPTWVNGATVTGCNLNHINNFKSSTLPTESTVIFEPLVSPNPSMNGFNISSSNNQPILTMELYDSQGGFIKRMIVNSNTYSFGQELPSGMYQLKVNTNETIYTKKIIKF